VLRRQINCLLVQRCIFNLLLNLLLTIAHISCQRGDSTATWPRGTAYYPKSCDGLRLDMGFGVAAMQQYITSQPRIHHERCKRCSWDRWLMVESKIEYCDPGCCFITRPRWHAVVSASGSPSPTSHCKADCCTEPMVIIRIRWCKGSSTA